MRRIAGVVQHYAWGDPEFLPELLGVEPDGQPWAEWWLGTHPGGPSTLVDDGPLRSVAGELPYLLKVLAAAEPLSLQTHPSAAQAEVGFAREQRDGPALDAPDRIYRDPSAKPELICALTPFDAVCGFRPVDETRALLAGLGADELATHLGTSGLAATVEGLYRRTIPIASTVAACMGRPEPEAQLVAELAGRYPGDPSAVVTLLLHRVRLEPGEALFLGPGNLHAYLHGVGVEVMGASDNVVRGGMTTKHVDVDELLAVLDISPIADPRTPTTPHGWDSWSYDTPTAPFRLWRHDVDGTWQHTATARELVLCTWGSTDGLECGEAAYLAPGDDMVLTGTATVFRVAEPSPA